MTVREMVLHLPVLAHVLQRIFGFSQSTVDKNIEIFWGVNSIHRREIISSSFSHAQASTRERRGANRFPRDLFSGLISVFSICHRPSFRFCISVFILTTPITTGALARPRCSHRAAAAPGFRTYGAQTLTQKRIVT